MTHQPRIAALALLLLVPFGAIEARLVWLQAIRGGYYRAEVEGKVKRIEAILPARGSIRDRNGVLLAVDERVFDVAVVPRDLTRSDRALHDLAVALGRAEAEIAALRDDPAATPETLASGLKGRAAKRARSLARAWRAWPSSEAVLSSLAEALGAPRGTVVEKYAQLETRLLETAARRDAAIQIDRLEGLRAEPRTLLTGFPFERVREIDLHAERFPGVLVEERTRRVYLRGRNAGNVVGYVGRFGTLPPEGRDEYRDLEERGFFRRGLEDLGEEAYRDLEESEAFVDEAIGRMGVERSYDDALRGRHGVMETETDRSTGATRVVRKVPAEAGSVLRMTMDVRLQEAVERSLEERWVRFGHAGAAVVLDPRDGAVLAIASVPGLDPTDFQSPVDRERMASLYFGPSARRDLRLVHRAFMGQYPAGSVFKIVLAIAGLEERQVTPDTWYECGGQYHDSPPYFRCDVYPGAHGRMTLEPALAQSCNVFFFHVGESLGVDAIASWGSRLGLGRRTGIDLPSEQTGDLPTPERRAARRGRWHPNDTLNLSIGQGMLTVTPLQVAVLLAAVANGGRVVTPHVNADLAGAPTDVRLSPATLDRVRRGLHDVVHESHGTASRTGLARFGVVGKTSTAEVSGAEGEERGPHAWFAGYAPEGDPKVAFAVVVENGGHGSEVAAPVAEEVLDAVFPPAGGK